MAVRQGFTMVEILVALVLLAVVLVGMQTATARFASVVSTSDRQALAGQVAEDRIELIQADPNFDALPGRYGESATELTDPAGFERTTAFTAVSDTAGNVVYRKITVTVDGPGIGRPVMRTVSVGRP